MIYDYSKLRGLIKEHCGTQIEFAKRLNISNTALTSKINQKTAFTQDEMRKSMKIFGLPLSDVDLIFFTLNKQKTVVN